ncbi:MAG: SPOR domain-containing protein [Deltaproteobacteria bacterium]|nr:SPOR domain-containing protein [Deltaproteobacteria bacterium]
MAKQITSRTKRRMEKRHAVLMLALVLVVSLISFGLGIMVGKRGTPPVVQKEQAPLVTRLPIVPEPAPTKEAAPAPQSSQPESKQQLTFYETLKEVKKQPLGTGINLPPQPDEKEEKPAAPPVEMKPAVQSSPPVAVVTPAAQPAVKAQLPVSGAKYAVQTGSFKNMEDAERLKSQLTAKGYAVFVQQADLKEKGVWYRVLLGPVATKSEAEALSGDLKKKENLAGFVRKM